MIALYDMTLICEVTCGWCGERHASGISFKTGNVLEIPFYLPPDWHSVDGKPVCPAHSVDVTRHAR